MLLSKSISKDVTNCYKVKITFFFFEKRITILPFSSKTNLAYKVATKIGTLVFKTSDFKNKRRYLFAQSVQFFMFGFSNSNLTKDRYTYTIYMGSAFRQVLFFLQKFFFWTTCSWNCPPFVQTADETSQDLEQPFRNQQFTKQATKEVAGRLEVTYYVSRQLRVKTSHHLEVSVNNLTMGFMFVEKAVK